MITEPAIQKTYRPSRTRQVKLLLNNLKNTSFGVPRFLLTNNPSKTLPIFAKRVGFSFWRANMEKPLMTPEGFMLYTNMDLLVYTCIFIEHNLYYKPFIQDLKYQLDHFNIIDVGANVGLFSQWIGSYNPCGTFNCIELWDENIRRGLKINKELPMVWHNNAAHHTSNKILEFNIGDSVTLIDTPNIVKKQLITSITVDYIAEFKKDIFALKIDTDGNNINVLDGALKTLPKTKWLLIEHEPGVKAWIVAEAPYFKLMKWTSPDDMIWRNTTL